MADFKHPRADAPGKVVLEEGKVLADDMPVALPADHIGDTGRNCLVEHQPLKRRHQRPDNKNEHNQAEDQRGTVGKDLIRRRRCQHLDEFAHENRDGGIGQRHEQAGEDQRNEQAFRLAHEEPVEAQKAFRRIAGGFARRGNDDRLEKAQHEKGSGKGRGSDRRRTRHGITLWKRASTGTRIGSNSGRTPKNGEPG
jgi:hypothetical protein